MRKEKSRSPPIPCRQTYAYSGLSAIVINLIGGLKLYDVVVSLSGGGPGFETSSLSWYIDNRYFKAEQAGYASAVGVVMFLFILLCSLILNGYFRKKEVEM